MGGGTTPGWPSAAAGCWGGKHSRWTWRNLSWKAWPNRSLRALASGTACRTIAGHWTRSGCRRRGRIGKDARWTAGMKVPGMRGAFRHPAAQTAERSSTCRHRTASAAQENQYGKPWGLVTASLSVKRRTHDPSQSPSFLLGPTDRTLTPLASPPLASFHADHDLLE